MKALLFSYVLGAVTFWPLVLAAYVLWSRWVAPGAPEPAPLAKPSKSQAYGAQHWLKLWDSGEDVPLDRSSDVEAACWVRFATSYVRLGDTADDADGSSLAAASDDAEKNARSSLQKLVGGSVFRHNQKAAQAKQTPAEKPLKSLSKLPKYWAVVRGGQLQLFEDQKERRLVNFVLLPEFVVTLWPQGLAEFELFYKRHPICLLARSGRGGLVQLDLYPGVPPRDALYLYVSNSTQKEDLYFALIRDSKFALPGLDPAAAQLSLGPRDPVEMARPIRIPKPEIQALQSQIWSSELPGDAKWLNALIGRLFFALKNSEWADEYLRRKVTTKLRPISASSGIIGDIDVRNIVSGSAPPLVRDVQLRELTPDGNLVLSARVTYTGGARVHLATMVKLSAVTSFTTAEIPIELAATLRHLQGTMLLRIKPAPSDRIWYAFESMPEIDLHMEPVVYDTQISLSVVTKYIKNRVVETLRESLVMPYMDDLSFYDTARSFYRGGIWERPPTMPSSTSAGVPSTAPPTQPAVAGTNLAVPRTGSTRRRTNGSTGTSDDFDPVSAGELPTAYTSGSAASGASSPVVSGGISGGTSGGAAGSSLDPSAGSAPVSSLSGTSPLPTPGSASSTGSGLGTEHPSKVRKFSEWVKRKRSNRSLHATTPDVAEEVGSSAASVASSYAGSLGGDGSDTSSLLSMSPGSVQQRTASTTQVTPANATTTRRGSENSVLLPSDVGAQSPPRRRLNQVRRKPVPPKQQQQSRVPVPPAPSEHDAEETETETLDTDVGDGEPSTNEENISPVLDSPEKWQPTVIVPKPRASLAESATNASGIPGDTASVISQELEGQERILRRSLSQKWPSPRNGDSPTSSPPRSQHFPRGSISDEQSIASARSVGSSGSRRKQPVLPPRHRKFVPLTNVPPEHAGE